MNAIKCQATIGTITIKRDYSLGLRLETPELTAEQAVAFRELQNQVLNMTLVPLDDPEATIMPIATEKAKQSPSARLRAVIFVLYKQKTDKGEDLGEFEG